jgi:hypothetical protein
LNCKPAATRWLLVLPILLVIVACWFTTRWFVGDVVAEYAPPAEGGGMDMAQLAARWAPADALTHWRLASFQEKAFTAENLAAAVAECKAAVEASPYDYRYWLEYGRALEANGDRDSAEKALRKAVELAPSYSQPLWYYGNVLLRQGKIDEAFQQMTLAAAGDDKIRLQVFYLASQIFEGDVDRMLNAVRSPLVRLQFVVYLINLGKFDDATRVLRSVSESDRRAQSDLTKQIVESLLLKKQYRAALAMQRELEVNPGDLPEAEQIWNGGFEDKLTIKDPSPFHWSFTTSGLAQISADTHAHTGRGSLRIVFKAPNRFDSLSISQTVIVEPNTQYRLQFYQSTQDLLSAGTPRVGINDPSDNQLLASSAPVGTGTRDWDLVTIDFKTKKTDGIQIVFYRATCSQDQSICPIFGTLWYDDFVLQRVGGANPQRNAAAQR